MREALKKNFKLVNIRPRYATRSICHHWCGIFDTAAGFYTAVYLRSRRITAWTIGLGTESFVGKPVSKENHGSQTGEYWWLQQLPGRRKNNNGVVRRLDMLNKLTNTGDSINYQLCTNRHSDCLEPNNYCVKAYQWIKHVRDIFFGTVMVSIYPKDYLTWCLKQRLQWLPLLFLCDSSPFRLTAWLIV